MIGLREQGGVDAGVGTGDEQGQRVLPAGQPLEHLLLRREDVILELMDALHQLLHGGTLSAARDGDLGEAVGTTTIRPWRNALAFSSVGVATTTASPRKGGAVGHTAIRSAPARAASGHVRMGALRPLAQRCPSIARARCGPERDRNRGQQSALAVQRAARVRDSGSSERRWAVAVEDSLSVGCVGDSSDSVCAVLPVARIIAAVPALSDRGNCRQRRSRKTNFTSNLGGRPQPGRRQGLDTSRSPHGPNA
jgi:hypothetical protein